MTSQVLEFHRAGKLRLLAITNPTRLPIAPEIPTAVETGSGPRYPAGDRIVCSGRRAEADHRADCRRECRTAMADKVYTQSLVDAAVIPVPDWTVEQFNQFMKEDVARWTPLVKAIGVKLD